MISLPPSELFPDFSTFRFKRALSEIPKDSIEVNISADAEDLLDLRRFAQIRTLRVAGGISQKLFLQLCRLESIVNLHLDHLRVTDLSPLRAMSELQWLSIRSGTKVASLEVLASMKNLSGLAIENFKKVSDVSPLGGLVQLKELGIEGSIWTAMRIKTLDPLKKLIGLRRLHMTNLRVEDGSLAPLEFLTHLAILQCGNLYAMEEFARLAGILTSCRCEWFDPSREPYDALGPCSRCGGTRIMLTGRGIRLMCSRCDTAKITDHVRRFGDIRDAAHRNRGS